MENSINGNLINLVNPFNYGILEMDLSENIIDYLWKISNRAKDKKNCIKHTLVGNISSSYAVEDENNYFFKEILQPALEIYTQSCNHKHPIKISQPANDGKDYYLKLNQFWVNYQNKHEFNPIHNHSGVYSFVIWLKIPYDYEDQCKLPQFKATKKTDLRPGCFSFRYHDILGSPTSKIYYLNKEDHEGKMILFPAQMEHEVYPFYNTDEQRVSMSGNIWLDTPNK